MPSPRKKLQSNFNVAGTFKFSGNLLRSASFERGVKTNPNGIYGESKRMYNGRMSKTKKVLQYEAVFHPEPEGGFSVSVPRLPGCFSEGNTLEDAEANISEAIICHLEGLAKSENKVPKHQKSTFMRTIDIDLRYFVHP